ncbi:MAG: Mur ligase family protein, partial [Bacteroidota bacterium]|nr:Mur ligase family protein [Bacteroidota bacterium]
KKLEAENIKTFAQGDAKIDKDTNFVVVSTAIEPSVPEYKQALELNIPIIHRSEMLKKITESKKTIAVSGTSGKSSTTAMIFTILDECGFSPSMLNGSGLVSLQKKGEIGNAAVGKGDWLVIEADESDGSLVNYSPEIGLILNIERDHKELDELEKIFAQFSSQVKDNLIVNTENEHSKIFSNNSAFDFASETSNFFPKNIKQFNNKIEFELKNTKFSISIIGLHNVENATATIAVCNYLGISVKDIAKAFKKYKGIDRRMQILGVRNDVTFIDDYAHNPVKIENAIKSAQDLGERVLAFFQPHGFAPMFFIKDEFIERIKETFRSNDEIYLPPIFYAGGTANKTISSQEIVDELKSKGVNAFVSSPRENFAKQIKNKLKPQDIVLIMGARDPSLDGR